MLVDILFPVLDMPFVTTTVKTMQFPITFLHVTLHLDVVVDECCFLDFVIMLLGLMDYDGECRLVNSFQSRRRVYPFPF